MNARATTEHTRDDWTPAVRLNARATTERARYD
jgi:hypothetical protein